jgi:hypothetical protein
MHSPTFPGPEGMAMKAILNSKDQAPAQAMTMSLQRSMGENTPPRSPTKAQQQHPGYAMSPSPSHSPSRQARPVMTQEQPEAKTLAALMDEVRAEEAHEIRMSKESIRIYADSEVYALLADVEEEFTRMGNAHYEMKEKAEELPTLGQGVFEGPSRSTTPKATIPAV